MPSINDRFLAKVDTSTGPQSCWPWTGYVDTDGPGYGQFWNGDTLVKAHRHAFELANGPITEGLVIDHACHNASECQDVPCNHRACCNPHHLEAVTQSINSIRGRSGDHQSSKTHCPNGHPYSEANTIVGRGGRHRKCRECNRTHQRNYNAKRKAA